MIYPLFMMVLLTFIVGLIAMKCRIASLKSGDVSLKYFKLMEGQEVPEIITKTSRCFNNMFEVPLLFYAGCYFMKAWGLTVPSGCFLRGFLFYRGMFTPIYF